MNTKNTLESILRKYLQDPETEIHEDDRLIADLGLVSMDVFGIVCEIEDTYGFRVPDAELGKYLIVGDIIHDIDDRLAARK